MGAEGAVNILYRKATGEEKEQAMKEYTEQFSNPYWMLNRQTPITDRNRYEFGGSVKYDIMEGLSVTGAFAL